MVNFRNQGSVAISCPGWEVGYRDDICDVECRVLTSILRDYAVCMGMGMGMLLYIRRRIGLD